MTAIMTTRHERVTSRPTPANVVAGIVGAGLFVLGVVAFLRTGIPTDTLTSPTVTAGWLTHTPLLALIHLLVGAALLGAAFSEVWTRPFLSFAAGLGLVGVIFTIETGALAEPLALTPAHGMTYLGAAAAMAAGVAITRVATSRR